MPKESSQKFMWATAFIVLIFSLSYVSLQFSDSAEAASIGKNKGLSEQATIAPIGSSGSSWSTVSGTKDLYYKDGNVAIGAAAPGTFTVGTTKFTPLLDIPNGIARIGSIYFNVNEINNTGLQTNGDKTLYLQFRGGGNTQIGSSASASNVTVYGNVNAAGFLYTSDATLKKDIHPLKNALDKALGLTGVEYRWKDANRGTESEIGFLAQDIEKLYPELVKTSSNGFKAVDYARLTPILLQALKEEHAYTLSLEARLTALEAKLNVK